MTFIIAFAAAVPTEKKDAYIEHVEEAAEFFKKHGAARVLEMLGEGSTARQDHVLSTRCAVQVQRDGFHRHCGMAI